jgi:CheY-like chemotaxis protein
LLCDDHPVNQKVAQRLLRQMGYDADLASNGEEALVAVERKRYDLIFMDVMMPRLSGFETTRIIRERQAKPEEYPAFETPLTIVAMTASAMEGDREKCLEAGMDDYLAKPVRLEDFRRIMEQWGPRAGKKTLAETTRTEPESRAAGSTVPVDLQRLRDFSDGDLSGARELAELFITQTAQQLEQLEAAVAAHSADEIRRLAHSCAGAAAACGVKDLVSYLRRLEKMGATGELGEASGDIHRATEEFERVREFLEKNLELQPRLASAR